MKEVMVRTYEFDELSESAKEKAREWWRTDMYDEYQWAAESVKDVAEEVGNILGITIDRIYYSVSYSQGDGACFEGNYSYQKGCVKAIKSFAPNDSVLLKIAAGLQEIQKKHRYLLSATVVQSGHYQHSGCTSITVHKDVPNASYWESSPEDAEEAITQCLRDFMDWIYDLLQKEFEYRESDEHVDEAILANEYEFTETGDRCYPL